MNKQPIIITLDLEEALATAQGGVLAIGAVIAQPLELTPERKDQMVFLCHLVHELIAQVARSEEA
jgi:hypothetical protein